MKLETKALDDKFNEYKAAGLIEREKIYSSVMDNIEPNKQNSKLRDWFERKVNELVEEEKIKGATEQRRAERRRLSVTHPRHWPTLQEFESEYNYEQLVELFNSSISLYLKANPGYGNQQYIDEARERFGSEYERLMKITNGSPRIVRSRIAVSKFLTFLNEEETRLTEINTDRDKIGENGLTGEMTALMFYLLQEQRIITSDLPVGRFAELIEYLTGHKKKKLKDMLTHKAIEKIFINRERKDILANNLKQLKAKIDNISTMLGNEIDNAEKNTNN